MASGASAPRPPRASGAPPTGGASFAWTSPSARAASRSSPRSSEGPDPGCRRLPSERREAPAHQPYFGRALAVGGRLRLERDALADPGCHPAPVPSPDDVEVLIVADDQAPGGGPIVELDAPGLDHGRILRRGARSAQCPECRTRVH